jgi:transcriptional regulator with XRE-family HTH domain
MPISPHQLRAARALLDWSQTHLAKAAGVGVTSVRDAERGTRARSAVNRGTLRAETLAKIRATLEAAGVVFLASGGASANGGDGVRLVSAKPARRRDRSR